MLTRWPSVPYRLSSAELHSQINITDMTKYAGLSSIWEMKQDYLSSVCKKTTTHFPSGERDRMMQILCSNYNRLDVWVKITCQQQRQAFWDAFEISWRNGTEMIALFVRCCCSENWGWKWVTGENKTTLILTSPPGAWVQIVFFLCRVSCS